MNIKLIQRIVKELQTLFYIQIWFCKYPLMNDKKVVNVLKKTTDFLNLMYKNKNIGSFKTTWKYHCIELFEAG